MVRYSRASGRTGTYTGRRYGMLARLSAAATIPSMVRVAASGLSRARVMYRAISSKSCRAVGRYDTLYMAGDTGLLGGSCNDASNRREYLVRRVSCARRFGFALRFLQFCVYAAIKFQCLVRLHAHDNHVADAVFCEEYRLAALVHIPRTCCEGRIWGECFARQLLKVQMP